MVADPVPVTAFVVADDHPMVRDALATALTQSFPGSRVLAAGTLGQTQAILDADADIDAVLLDLNMPGMDGLTGLAILRADHPAVPIIVISATTDTGVSRRTTDLGAAAFIAKSASLVEIARIVAAVLRGELVAVAEPSVETAGPDAFARRAARLTPQQWRVLALMIQGEQNKLIAWRLGVGESTVKAHVTEILRKLGVRSRTQAVVEARHLALPVDPVRP